MLPVGLSLDQLTIKALKQTIEKQAAEIERLRAALAADRWIPVTERLPEILDGGYSAEVLVYTPSGQMLVAHYNQRFEKWFDGEWGWIDGTHWRPLPEGPEEGQA